VIRAAGSNPSRCKFRLGRAVRADRGHEQGVRLGEFNGSLDRFPEAEVQISQWIKEGRINYREEIHEGLEHAPGSLQRLYKGENTGKFVMRLPVAKTRVNE
jgi:hypothetical protein